MYENKSKNEPKPKLLTFDTKPSTEIKETNTDNKVNTTTAEINSTNQLVGQTVTKPNNFSSETEQNSSLMMVQSIADAMKIASQTVMKTFDGNPLQLKSFTISLDLLDALIEAEHKAIMIKFVLSRLEGKALECIPDNVTEIKTIKEALEKFIVHDSAKIVAGKMEALRADKTNLTDFTKRAEELAESLQRSLVVEGCTKDLALEMAVDKTIEMCRKSARSEIVKSVLASKSFKTPKEVVATYIVQSATETQEKQVMAFHTQNNSRGNYRNNSRGNFNNYRGNYSNNYANNYSNNYNNNRGNRSRGGYRGNYSNNNNRNNYNNNNFQNFNRNNNNNYRGNSRGNYQNRGNYSRNSNNNNNNNNPQNIRSFEQNDNSQNELGFHNQSQTNQDQQHQINLT